MGIFRSSQGPQRDSATLSHVAIGTRVQIVGEPGTYVVVRVDPQRYTADLMLLGQPPKVESGVRFQSLRSLPQKGDATEALEKLSGKPSGKIVVD